MCDEEGAEPTERERCICSLADSMTHTPTLLHDAPTHPLGQHKYRGVVVPGEVSMLYTVAIKSLHTPVNMPGFCDVKKK